MTVEHLNKYGMHEDKDDMYIYIYDPKSKIVGE